MAVHGWEARVLAQYFSNEATKSNGIATHLCITLLLSASSAIVLPLLLASGSGKVLLAKRRLGQRQQHLADLMLLAGSNLFQRFPHLRKLVLLRARCRVGV